MAERPLPLVHVPKAWRTGLWCRLGLPVAQRLARGEGASEAQPLAGRRACVGGAQDLAIHRAVTGSLLRAGANLERRVDDALELGVFVGTSLNTVAQLRSLYEFFHCVAPHLAANARVVVIARDPDAAADSEAAAVRRGVEGFVRSLAREIGKRGATANLLYVAEGAELRLEGPLRFLLSTRSAFVSGQAIRITREAFLAASKSGDVSAFSGKVALVTGAARGIGAAIAQRLGEEGAAVVRVDREGEGVLQVDLTAADAPTRVAQHLADTYGGADIVVHNAGILRDRTIGRMEAAEWDASLAVNLDAILGIDAELDRQRLLRDHGRVIFISSIAGLAGNVGQTNYATAKAALVGYARDRARRLAHRGICVNAVAPGLIETPMMRAMPWLFREIARRMNSLGQAGVPRDVAEVVTFLATPGACGITGQTLRVCGQNLIGA